MRPAKQARAAERSYDVDRRRCWRVAHSSGESAPDCDLTFYTGPELARHPTVWKAGGLVVNIAIVVYLVLGLVKRRLRDVEQ